MGGHDWEDWTPEAIAALRAMREPTEGMVNAAWATTGYRGSITMIDWQAMIDQAIKEAEA